MLSRTTERLRIVVTGYVVRGPLGGMAWHFLQYVRGLADLGHDVYYVEDSDDVPFCLHPWMLITDRDPKEGIEFTRKAFDDLALEDRFAYYDAHTGGWLGPCAGRILEVCRTADLLLSVAAWINPLRPWLAEIPARAFLDTDPAFTQIVHLTNAPRKSRASQYTSFFSGSSGFLVGGQRVAGSSILPTRRRPQSHRSPKGGQEIPKYPTRQSGRGQLVKGIRH